jgi:hypothetical protein
MSLKTLRNIIFAFANKKADEDAFESNLQVPPDLFEYKIEVMTMISKAICFDGRFGGNEHIIKEFEKQYLDSFNKIKNNRFNREFIK